MTRPSSRPPLVLCAALCSLSCGPKNLRYLLGPPLPEAAPPLVLAAPVVLHQQLHMDSWGAFHEGYYVGNIWFSGGYELQPEEDNQVRSVNVEFSAEPEYLELASAATQSSFSELLTEHGVTWQALAEPVDRAFTPPRRTPVRGTGRFDGEDNQNLPRYDLQPLALEAASLPDLPAGTRAVLVPLVVQYYTHNGGWFVGQQLGCPAGARARVLWSLHDAQTGSVLTWGEVGVQHLQEYYYSPNQAELQDYQQLVEAALREHLDQQLP